MSEEQTARPGTTADLSRRMDRMEVSHEALAREVAGLTTTIGRVELNQNHAEELNKLRFDSVNQSIVQVEGKLDKHASSFNAFIERIEGIIDGTIQTGQTREGQKVLAEYELWRGTVETRLDEASTLAIQLRFLSRIIVVLTGGSLVATATAVFVALTR
jgi:seryl-tRNA synthetase